MTERRPRAGGRRLASVVVLVVACVALLATSQPPDESHLQASGQLTVELTAAEPRASGTLQLDISAEALPEPAGQLSAVRGTIRFQQPADQRETVVITVEAVDLPTATREEFGETIIDLDLLCRVAEPCSRELRVTLEWLGAAPASTLIANVGAMLDVVYAGVRTNPEGATASVRVSAQMQPMPAGPELRAQTPEERFVLDAGHWAASRHVVLTATAAARKGRIVAFLDHSIGQQAAPYTHVSIVADEGPQSILSGLEPFEPFVTCPSRGACERRFTIHFELGLTDATAVAPIDWSLGMRAAFPDSDDVPPGAGVSVVVDARTDVTDDALAVSSGLSGTLPPANLDVEGDFVRQSTTITIRATSIAAPGRTFGGPVPTAARAVLTVRGALVASVVVNIGDGGEYTSRELSPEQPEFALVFDPLQGCAAPACTSTLRLSSTTQRPDGGAQPAPIEWDLQVVVVDPEDPSRPPPVELQLVETAEPD